MTYRSTGVRRDGDDLVKDFGIDTALPLDSGGMVIGDTVQISLDIRAVHQNE